MCCKGFLKRLVPFFLALAVGLFIASFFVTIAAPRFSFKSRDYRKNHRQYHHQIESENQRLKVENLRLKKELSEKERREIIVSDLEYLDAPPPPPALRAVPFRDR